MRYILAVALVLCAVPAFAATATLTWTDNSTNESGFNVQRKLEVCAGSGAWSDLAQVGANVTTYKDGTIQEGVPVCYRVNAYNSAGASAWSNTAGGVPPFTIPAVPSQLGVTFGP